MVKQVEQPSKFQPGFHRWFVSVWMVSLLMICFYMEGIFVSYFSCGWYAGDFCLWSGMYVGVSNPSILAKLFVKNAEKSNHENIQPSDLVGHEIYYIMMHLLCYAKLPDPLFKNCMTSPHESKFSPHLYSPYENNSNTIPINPS